MVRRHSSGWQASLSGRHDRLSFLGRTGVCYRLASLLILMAACNGGVAAQGEAWMDTVKGLHPHVEFAYSDDSNLLRESDGRSDRYLTLGGGFDTELGVNRQRIRIDGSFYHNNYDRFNELDHTGGDARALWQWIYGDRWEGELGYSYNRKLRDLTNQETPLRDMLDRHAVFAGIDRWLTTRWRANAKARWAHVASSEGRRLNKEVFRSAIGADYISADDNSLGMEVTMVDAAYDIFSERDYQEWYVGPRAGWQVTAKTRIDARIGYVDREHDGLEERDFGGAVGSLSARWEPTAKTSIVVSAARQLSSLEDEISDYAVVDSFALEPVWSITPKTALRAEVRYEERDFETGGSPTAVGAEGRKDDVRTYGVWVDWAFLRNSKLSVGFETEERDSTIRLEEYDYDLVQARLRIGI